MEQQTKGQTGYDEVQKVQDVLLKVPSAGCPHLCFVESHTLHDGVTIIPDHYRHGQMIGNVLVTRHFYDITGNDLGKRIVADVTIVKKSYPDGSPARKAFAFNGAREGWISEIAIDIHKKGGAPQKVLKILLVLTAKETREGNIRIPLSGGGIRFEDFVPYVPPVKTDVADNATK